MPDRNTKPKSIIYYPKQTKRSVQALDFVDVVFNNSGIAQEMIKNSTVEDLP